MASHLTLQPPLVSVIIPFLNGKEWLSEAIDSVIGQSYSDWEIILVDDGSAQDATAIAKQYAERYPHKIVYAEHPEHKNKGVAASRNLGISVSKGELIALLDSDDCWLPEKLQCQVMLFAGMPLVQVVCEASKYWYSWENPMQADLVIEVGTRQNKVYFAPELMYELYPLGKGAAPCPTGLIMRRGVIDRIGGFEESFVGRNQVYEDQAFLSKVYLHETVYISGEANNLYRQRSGSLMQSIDDKQRYRKVRAYFLSWLKHYLHSRGLMNARLQRSLRLAMSEVNHPYLFRIRRRIGQFKRMLAP